MDPKLSKSKSKLVCSSIAKCFLDDRALQPGETVVLKVMSTHKTAVIQRETDLLTPQELRQHEDLVDAAILEELTTWHGHGCFVRQWKKDAYNVMDSRFVAKWKILNEHGKKQRIIRMRMALRGFKDLEADRVANFSATTSRLSQRLINSQTATRPDFIEISIDINKAFLKGLTYEELAQLTGEPKRNVAFVLPKGAVKQLRKLEGFADFNEDLEVLACTKPGTGCKDAPRAFSLKLALVTRSPSLALVPTTMDTELELQHQDKELIAMLGKHVDDVKLAGKKANVMKIVKAIEDTFGKVTSSYSGDQISDFTNCGVRHTRHPDGSVCMDQDEYIAALKPIRTDELRTSKSSDPCSASLQALFGSLLGAVAYSLLTQSWIAGFVIALQRVTHKPTILHVKRLNLIVKALQVDPKKLVFPNMECARELEVHADSAFSKEDDRGYAIKGINIMRNGYDRATGEVRWHLLESAAQSHKNVVRSTFGAELFAVTGAADQLIPLLVTFEELTRGPRSLTESKRLREEGGWCYKSLLVTDSMSLFQAVLTMKAKIPSEKSTALHLFWLRELIRKQIVSGIRWCDTRDMTADGHTKGNVSRDHLLDLMVGRFEYKHAFQDSIKLNSKRATALPGKALQPDRAQQTPPD